MAILQYWENRWRSSPKEQAVPINSFAKRIGRKKVAAQTYNMVTMIIQM